MSFNNLRIGNRLAIGFAAVLLMMVVITAVGFLRMAKTEEALSNSIEIAKGPVIHYPSGYGASGLDGDVGVLNNGVPSQAAQTGLIEPTIITDQVDLNGKLVFFDATWNASSQLPNFGSRLYVSIELTGVLFTAATI